VTAAAWRVALAVTVVVQLVVLYWPDPGGPEGVPHLDKAVHLLVFGAVALTGRLAGLPARLLAVLLAAHAVVSELVQHAFLPGRSGDVLDVAADLAGAAVGLLLARALLGARATRLAGAGDHGSP